MMQMLTIINDSDDTSDGTWGHVFMMFVVLIMLLLTLKIAITVILILGVANIKPAMTTITLTIATQIRKTTDNHDTKIYRERLFLAQLDL